ncbi:hypothetical protein JNUCC6_04285 [Viridibacillus arvi]|nr:hypothetical protein JNUCC6_04285 [Viridibacillus sp. JNUCC-6]
MGNGPSFGEIILEDIKFDSSDLVKIAKEKYDLQKGVDWATGYRFTIAIGPINVVLFLRNNFPNSATCREQKLKHHFLHFGMTSFTHPATLKTTLIRWFLLTNWRLWTFLGSSISTYRSLT